jgi:hypothetical protein
MGKTLLGIGLGLVLLKILPEFAGATRGIFKGAVKAYLSTAKTVSSTAHKASDRWNHLVEEVQSERTKAASA